jgi:hypothetical protein
VAALKTADVSSTAASECERAETEAGPAELDFKHGEKTSTSTAGTMLDVGVSAFKNGEKTSTSTAGTMLDVGVSARSCDPSQVSKYKIHIIL